MSRAAHEQTFAAYMVRPEFQPRSDQQTDVTLCGVTVDVSFDFEAGDEPTDPGTYTVDAVKLGGAWFSSELLPDEFVAALTMQLAIEFAAEREAQMEPA